MLYDIQSPATAENSVILLHPRDTVAVARLRLEAGQSVEAGRLTVLTRAAIPAGHKVAGGAEGSGTGSSEAGASGVPNSSKPRL